MTNRASVTGVHVVLHDRDTDDDLLPDVWEWTKYGSLTAHSGFEASVSNAYVSLTWSDPSPANLTNWIWTIDNSQIVTRQVEIPEQDTLRVRVNGPRTFLHEGDLLTPYTYVQHESGLRAIGYLKPDGQPADWDEQTGKAWNSADYLGNSANRDSYLWKRNDEGVWVPQTEPYYGFYLGSYSNSLVKWTVDAWNGADMLTLTNGSFRVVAPIGSSRKPLIARYPTQLTVVRDNVVEFEWEMDDRNAGVLFNLWKVQSDTNGNAINRSQVVTNMVLAFPIRHGIPGTGLAHYSAVPQLEDGMQLAGPVGNRTAPWTPDIGKVFLDLPDLYLPQPDTSEDGIEDVPSPENLGWYEYSITERPQTDLVEEKTVLERFQKKSKGDDIRGVHSISGRIEYYGKVMDEETVAVGFASGDGQSRVLSGSVDASLVHPGAMSVRVMRNGNVKPIESFNDSKGNGVLFAESGTNAFSGSIIYHSDDDPTKAEISLNFLLAPASDMTLDLVVKKFPKPVVIQAFRVPDSATSAQSISGVPAVQTIQDEKGFFRLDGLEKGVYTVRAWIDGNENGIFDAWETIGYATHSSTVSPVLDSAAEPIEVVSDVTGTMIVLHDRDTDNDLLPDAWEWVNFGTLLTSGFEQKQPGLYIWQEYADGPLDSDPRTPDTDLDGLTDAMEILVTGTDTHLADTDADGVGDLEEFLAGSDPLDPADTARYSTPALAFDADGVPYVDVDYPALKPGVVLTYELQRKLSLSDETWETVAEASFGNTNGVMSYGTVLGANDDRSPAGTARMRPADQAEGVDFAAGFYRVKIYADYGKMVDNGDGTWSYWTWVRDTVNVWTWSEAARGEGTLVRDGEGNWRFVADPDDAKSSGSLVRGADGSWTFVQ